MDATLSDWIGSHTRALSAIGAAPRLIVPDNAKVAAVKACLYEPQVNRTYAEMATHYGAQCCRPGRAGRGACPRESCELCRVPRGARERDHKVASQAREGNCTEGKWNAALRELQVLSIPTSSGRSCRT
jgi:hypothetical protein